MRILTTGAALALLTCLAPAVGAAAPAVAVRRDKDKNKSAKTFELPYKFTSASHIVVRCKINGKGPFNFVLDTGAPALYVAVPVGKKAKVKADKDGWADLDKFEFEGGLVVEKARARIETPFQLEGMNGLGLAGLEIHGLIGYNILAKYRMTFDFTTDKLVFTELDYKPEQPFSMKGKVDEGGIDMMKMMGQVMKMVGAFMKRKPAGDVTLRGFFGMTLKDGDGGAVVETVLEKGPAGTAGLKAGDVVTAVEGKSVEGVAGVVAATEKSTGKVKLSVKRGGEKKEITIETSEGI